MQKRIKIKYILFIALLFFFSCNQKKTDRRPNTFAPTLISSAGFLVSKDYIALPESIPVHQSKLKKIRAGKPLTVPVNTNIYTAGIPKIVIAGKPKIITPGTDTFLLSKKILTIGTTVNGNMPETIVAGDMTYKVPNPSSFGSYGKLQGLKHNIVTCLLQDKMGNIWICTAGGVTRYDGRSFTNFTEKEGLVNKDVRSILQDQWGNIWFGSLGGGISKYDGYQFTNFTTNDGLSHSFVDCMVEDNAGNIWFGTWGGGVSKYDGHSFTNFTQREGLVNNFVQTVNKDRMGNIWFGTSGGVSIFNGKSFRNYTQKEGLSSNHVYCFLEDRSGNMWFGTSGGVNIFNGTTFVQYSTEEGLVNNEVFCITEDKEGDIWLGTHYGISRYDGRSFTNYTQKHGLTNDNIYCILEDNAGNMWFGTGGGGISKYNPHSFTHFTEAEGLNKNYVFSVQEDKSGNIWYGNWRGGVSEFDGSSFKNFIELQGLVDNDVRSICQDRFGNFWFATSKGVSKYDGHSFIQFTEKEGLINNDVNSIAEDKYGNLWFGTANGASKYDGKTVTNFTKKQGLSNAVYCIRQDRSGSLLFGTSGGVFKYDNHSFTHLTSNESVTNYDALCIVEDNAGSIWFGTEHGVFKYDGQHIIQLSEREGLINNDVVSILEDKSGTLWFGTRFGLSRLSPEKKRVFFEKVKSGSINQDDIFFKNFRYTDNFLGISCNQGAILQSREGKIWIGTNGGLTTFDPLAESRDTIIPNIQITAVNLANENIDWTKLSEKKDSSFLLGNGIRMSGFQFDQLSRWYNLPDHLSLRYDNNYISFDFIGITMSQPQNVKYQYQLEGFEKRLSALTTQTFASYGNLIPGKYTFKVRAMNSDGYWSNELEYTFTIRPPWWQTWWFKILAVVFLVSVVFFTVRFIYFYQLRKKTAGIEKQLAVQFERQRISSDLHDDIGSTLSSINIYAGLAKKEADNALYLDSIRQNVNEVVGKLDDLVWSINPKYDTIGSMAERLYVYAESTAKMKEIIFNISVDDQVKEIRPPAEIKHNLFLVTKEIINNAIKHSKCKHINVQFSGNSKELNAELNDDGNGFNINLTRKDRNGLTNIKQRVSEMQGEMEISSSAGAGTRIIIRIPV